MNLLPYLTSAAVGALVAALSGLFTAWLIQRSEEKRQLRSLAFQVAIENWKTLLDTAKKATEKDSKDRTVMPLDLFLIHASDLISSINTTRKSLTPEEIRRNVRFILDNAWAAQDEFIKYTEKHKKDSASPSSVETK